MIRLYRNKDKIDSNSIIVDNDSFFNNNVAPKDLSEISLKVMNVIDNAVLIDKEIGTIKTPYGVTSIDCLSTGCKTILNYIFLSSNKYNHIKAIDATGCGWNALEGLFKAIEESKYDIAIILEHNNDLYNCSDREYIVDDNESMTSLFDF